MKKEFPKKFEKVFLRIGIVLLVLGLFLNQWMVTKIISPDGLPAAAYFFVWTQQAALFILGVLFIVFRKNSSAIANLLLLVGTVVLFLVAAEVLLRCCHYKVQKLKLFKENPFQTGSYRLLPNLDLITNIEGQKVHIRTNRFGMPWGNVDKQTKDARKRVAVVGDSFAFGCWVEEFSDGMTGVFKDSIDSGRFEVLNFAVCGYGPGDIALQLKEEVLPFSVDYILVFFWNGNDFGDAYSGLDRYAVVDGTIKWRNEGANRFLIELKEFMSNLSLYKLVSHYMGLMQARKDFSLNKPVTPAVAWSLKEDSPLRIEARKKTLEEMEKIKVFALQHQIKLMIVAIPFEEQVYAPKLVYEKYDFHLPQKYIEDFARTNNIPYLDLLPFLRSYVATHKESIFLKNDVHFNQQGHEIVGEQIAGFFDEYSN
ncbi:MAG: SGNH/GDSL hydrolase family protein [Candidatus Omnitrophota bacterium]